MREIPVYNHNGCVINTIDLPEDVEFVSGRTSKSETCYYKGVGSKYKCHASITKTPYKKLGRNPVFYYGDDVQNTNWLGKFGIFQERFQPYFSDFIGSCGPKERSIETKSVDFSYSAVRVLDRIDYDIENQQSYYKLEYTSPRDHFIDDGKTIDFINLMDCMLHEGWNFPWDKTSVRDINNQGKVTDVADIFHSHNPIHKFGTVYSVLYSTFQIAPLMYSKLLSQMGLKPSGIEGIPFVVLFAMGKLGFTVPMRQDLSDKESVYTHLIGNVLLRGRNCASVEDLDAGNEVMLQYVDRFRLTLTDKNRGIMTI